MFVLNAKWLCDHYLMKATHDTLSGSTLFFAVEHVKQPLKICQPAGAVCDFLEVAVLVAVGSR